MGNLKRVGRTIIATGGVNTPALKNLITETSWHLGVGISTFNDDGYGGGSWDSTPNMVWLSRGIRPTYPGRSFAGYPSFTYADEERILCSYYMSWMGGGEPTTMDIEGVYFVED